MSDQSLESSDQVHKLGGAPAALRILGGAALAWGAFRGSPLVGQSSANGAPGGGGWLPGLTPFPLLVGVSERGFEPRRAMRPLGPQPSASTSFRHSADRE